MKEGWEKKKLGEVITVAKTIKNSENKDYPILSITMRDGIVMQKDRFKKVIASVDTSSYKVVKNGQLVIAFPIDEGLIYTQDITDIGIMSPAYNIWDVDYSSLNRKFLVKYLHSDFAMGYYKSKLRGTTQRRRSIPKEDLLSMPVPVPPLSVQESIVSELDMLSGIISKHKALQEEYDRLEQSIFYDMFGDPVTNEKGWDKKTLDSLYKVSSSKRIMQSEWTTSGIPFLKVADFVSMIQGNTPSPLAFISEEKYDELKKDNLIPRENDILITSRGTLGLCYIVKDSDAFYFQDGMVSWLSNSNGEILSDYLVKIFKYPSFIAKLNETSNKSTVAYVSISQLSKIQVPVPPLSLQQSFADKISAIEQMKAKNKAAQEEAEMLFNERMAYYF